MRAFTLGALLVALASLAHAESRPHYGGTVEASLLGAPLLLDPVSAQTHAEITVVDLVFDTLYRVGIDGIVQSRLALGHPVLDAAKTTARIAIRRGVRFHDGTELTAADVIASLERAHGSWPLAPILAMRVESDVLVVTLRAPTADLATLLALPQLAISKGGTIGTGPFAIEARDPAKNRLVLRAFDDYFAGRPYLDQLVLHWYDTPDGEARQFETGAAQLSARGVAAFAGAQPKYKADDVEGPAALLVYAGWGRAHEAITKDARFRRALDLALARGALTTIGAGERIVPTRLPWPVEAGAPVLDTVGKAGDVDGAKQALAGLAVGATKLEILVEATRPDDREIAERVARALDNLGVGATITALPADKLRERVGTGTCDLYIGQLAEPVTDVVAWWGGAFAAGGDDYVAQKLALGPLDLAAAGKAFAARLPIVPLMFRAVRIWHRTDVRGLGFDATGRPDLASLFLHGAPLPSRKP